MSNLMKRIAKGKDKDIGWFNKIKENYNPKSLIEPGGLLEKAPFVNSEGESQFAAIMDVLRDVDGDVREEEIKSKNNVKAAKSSFNRREYIACITYLSQYHDSLKLMMESFSRLDFEVNKIHNDFLFGGVDEEALQYFREKLPTKFQPKTAGISDWWSNLTTTKGRGLVAWEKRFPKFAKKFKAETGKLLDKAESLQKLLSTHLKAMASLRASRRLEEYLDAVKVIISKYNEFDKLFEKYYAECVKQFMDQQQVNQSNAPKADPLADLIKKKKEELESELVEHGPPSPIEGDWNGPPSPTEGDWNGPPSPIEGDWNGPPSPTEGDWNGPEFDNGNSQTNPAFVPFGLLPERTSVPEEVGVAEERQVNNFLKGDDLVLYKGDTTVEPDPKSAPEHIVHQLPAGKGPLPSVIREPRRESPISGNTPVAKKDTPAPMVKVSPNGSPIRGPVIDGVFDEEGPDPDAETVITTPYNPSPTDNIRQLPAGQRVLVTPDSASAPRLNAAPPRAPQPTNRTEPFGLAEDLLDTDKKNPVLRNTKKNSPKNDVNRVTAQQFLENLTKLSDQSPIVLANEIIKYAKQINNKATSEKLLAIAKNILK